jgi:hypothetical protein
LAVFPANYSFDGFQRWAGRDHVLVQAWLPVTQAVIALVSAAGGGVIPTRIAMALIAASAAAAGTVLAERLGGRAAAWAFVVPASYGPFLVWGAALYQEGTFLLVLFSALALALAGRERWADLVIGLLGLVRYEGWPCVALYFLWRRDPRALVSLWGIAVWLFLRVGLHLPGYAASPVDFDDWEGLGERTTLAAWAHDAASLFWDAWNSGGISFAVAGVIGSVVGWKRRGVPLLVAIGLVQVAAVSGWLAGLEVATYRMLVVPVLLAGLLGAVGAAHVWERLPQKWRPALLAVGALLLAIGHLEGWRGMRSEYVRTGPERALLAQMEARPECTWTITPRNRLGTRLRHDGCEVVQGLGERRHGDGFWCTTWPGEPPAGGACVASARWERHAYTIDYSDHAEPARAGLGAAGPTGAASGTPKPAPGPTARESTAPATSEPAASEPASSEPATSGAVTPGASPPPPPAPTDPPRAARASP